MPFSEVDVSNFAKVAERFEDARFLLDLFGDEPDAEIYGVHWDGPLHVTVKVQYGPSVVTPPPLYFFVSFDVCPHTKELISGRINSIKGLV